MADARACNEAGQLADAQALCRQVLERDSRHVNARLLLASLCHRSGDLDASIRQLTELLALQPDHALAHHLLGAALAQQGKLDAAVASLERAVQLQPDVPEVRGNLLKLRAARDVAAGRPLAQNGRYAEAAALYRRALEHDADFVGALMGLGFVLTRQVRLEEAEACYRRVVALIPDAAEAHFNLAIPLVKQNKLEDALAAYRRAIALQPDNAEFHMRYALTLLLAGYHQEGWREYDWRWKQPGRQEIRPGVIAWQGERLPNGTVVLATEQGFGDALHFIRFAPLVKQRVANVIVECQPALARLLATCPGVDGVVARGQALPSHAAVAPLLNLPRVLQADGAPQPATVPYLFPAADAVAAWRQRLAGSGAVKVGIAWQGSASHLSDQERSIPLERFAPLAAVAGVQLYSLQVAAGREQLATCPWRELVVDLTEKLTDFCESAALVENLDLVITCDSAPAHLAGALGRPVWVALPFAPDWRWLVTGHATPWYPTMRLFRQAQPGNWPEVFARIEDALRQFVATRPAIGG